MTFNILNKTVVQDFLKHKSITPIFVTLIVKLYVWSLVKSGAPLNEELKHQQNYVVKTIIDQHIHVKSLVMGEKCLFALKVNTEII